MPHIETMCRVGTLFDAADLAVIHHHRSWPALLSLLKEARALLIGLIGSALNNFRDLWNLSSRS